MQWAGVTTEVAGPITVVDGGSAAIAALQIFELVPRKQALSLEMPAR
jgi:hypothetical protein